MTQQPPILISTRDLARLEQLLETQPAAACAGLEALEAELSRAEIVSPEQMPADVVTMNATVCFQLAGASQPFTLTLVYPDEMDNSQDRLSILAPVGSALLPYPLAMWFLLSSLLTWLIYGTDKLAARKAWRRVPETTLLVLGLAGGWPGAILGQQCFRHKTQKQPFRRWFFVSVALNVAALAGLYLVYTHLLSR